VRRCAWRWLCVALALAPLAGVRCIAAEPAWGIVVDPARRLCFADAEADVVWCADALYQPAARLIGVHSHDLMTVPPDRIVGDDQHWDPVWRQWRRGIWQISSAGERRELAPPSLAPRERAGLLVDHTGNRYEVAADGAAGAERLVRVAPDGSSTLLAGGAPGMVDGRGVAAGLVAVHALAWGGDGRIYLTDGNALRKVALDGTVTTVAHVPDSPTGPAHLLGLAPFARGVVVADFAGRRLLTVAGDGAIAPLAQSDIGWAPTGVVAEGDTLYILEHRSASAWARLAGFFGSRLRVVRLRGSTTEAVIEVAGAGGLGTILAVLLGAVAIVAVCALLTSVAEPDPAPAPTATTPLVDWGWRAEKKSAGPVRRLRRWVADHLFQLVASLVLVVALVLFSREMLQPTIDAAAVGTLALVLLVAGLASHLGPDLIAKVSKIGPVEFVEKSAWSVQVLTKGVDGLSYHLEDGLKGSLTQRQMYAYYQLDLDISIHLASRRRISDSKDQNEYWRCLVVAGTAALIAGDIKKAISRLELVQEESKNTYKPAEIAFTLGFAYTKEAEHNARSKSDFETKAAQCFSVAARAHYSEYAYLAFFQLALIELDRGYYGSAVTNNRNSLSIRPQYGSAKYNLAIALHRSSQTEEAWKVLKSITSEDDDFEKIAAVAWEDKDLAPFRADPAMFEDLAFVVANPLPWPHWMMPN
jgi:hypothetical protein